MKTTRWRPDTCECEIEYDWDELILNGLHINHKFIKQCSYHLVVGDVIQHNQTKNIEITKIMSETPIATETKDGIIKFKENFIPTWEIKNGQIVVGLDQITDTGVIKIR